MSGLEPLLLAASSAASSISPWAALLGAGVSAVGTIASGQQAAALGAAEQQRLNAEGLAAKQAAEYEAAQLDIQAKDERAAGQREMLALRRNKKLALSKLQAGGAAGGFTATDPTSLALAGEIEKYGTYQEQMAMYGGDAKATSLTASAEGRRYSGDTAYQSAIASGNIARASGEAKKTSSYFNAGSTIIGGISDFGKKYASGSSGFTPYYRSGTLVTSRYA